MLAWEVDDSYYKFAHKFLWLIKRRYLCAGLLDAKILTEIDMQDVGRFAGFFEYSRTSDASDTKFNLQKIIKRYVFHKLSHSGCPEGDDNNFQYPRMQDSQKLPCRLSRWHPFAYTLRKPGRHNISRLLSRAQLSVQWPTSNLPRFGKAISSHPAATLPWVKRAGIASDD